MATYIGLLKYTDQGIKGIKQGPARLAAARRAATKLGCKLVSFHLTFGPYDAVTVVEAKDDESMAAFTLASASQGNIGTLTMRAFNETEYKRIIAKLP
ncbi:MAG TPA: GYD domain-containing protein [Candidatus Dormibacteraeota bacterium]|nr:GYD domain-containing protein [Candidatus Dormibacteraeota bacterium]